MISLGIPFLRIALHEKGETLVQGVIAMGTNVDNPFKPLSADEISLELAEARKCAELGEIEDFDVALEEISKKYGLE